MLMLRGKCTYSQSVGLDCVKLTIPDRISHGIVDRLIPVKSHQSFAVHWHNFEEPPQARGITFSS
jgi:hypothetical protein